MQIFCPDCESHVDIKAEDHSVEHEFGTEWVIDFHCAVCSALLQTRRSKPTKVSEPDYN